MRACRGAFPEQVRGSQPFGSGAHARRAWCEGYTTEKRLELIKLLLRAGATANPPAPLSLVGSRWVPTYDATWALGDAVARRPELADDEHYLAAERLVKGVIAAGSYKKYVRLPLQDLLNLLSLAQRGKLATTDPVMKSLVGVDNHVVWNVLTYWVES